VAESPEGSKYMPAKGKAYSRVEVDCARWAREWLDKTGLKPADLARALGRPNRFTHDLLKGKINTICTIEVIVYKMEGGNYLAMTDFAQTDESKNLLRELQVKSDLAKEGMPEGQLDSLQRIINTLHIHGKRGVPLTFFESLINEGLDQLKKEKRRVKSMRSP